MMDSHARRAASPALALALIAGLVVIGCEPGPPEEPPPPEVPPAVEPTPEPAVTLTDPEIVMVLMTANSADSATGEMARTRAQSAEVRQFAETMVTDHGAANRRTAELTRRLNLTPQDSDLSRQIQQTTQQARQRLEQQTGQEFDRAYIQHEVSFHQTVLDTIDNALLPSAQNPELRSLIEETRPVIVQHLQRAQQLQGVVAMR